MANAPQVKFQPQPANLNGFPSIISVVASESNSQSRTFWGNGAPSSTTLPGTGQINGNNRTAFYFAADWNYAPLQASAPDMYFDIENIALYICTTSGSNAVGSNGGSVWKRISGGGGGSQWQSPRELNPAVAVPQWTYVYISPQSSLVSTGMIDLGSGVMTTSRAGIWQALQAVPAQVTAGGVTKYNMPQIPYPGATGLPTGSPLRGDLDGAGVFWAFIQEVMVCS